MRYWVHALRYVRSYWSKLEVRDTVINEDHERKLLERILREEESDDVCYQCVCTVLPNIVVDVCVYFVPVV